MKKDEIGNWFSDPYGYPLPLKQPSPHGEFTPEDGKSFERMEVQEMAQPLQDTTEVILFFCPFKISSQS
jgi:hypothetical protein